MFSEFIKNNAVSDLYLSDGGDSGVWFPSGDSLPENLLSHAKILFDLSNKNAGDDFSIRYNEIQMRCRRIRSVKGVEYFLRFIGEEPWALKDLGLPAVIREKVLHEDLNDGGLIIICGRPGQGKSTTSSSIVSERLKVHGGLCITIEDPVEVIMHGMHGKGRCIQMELTSGDEYVEFIRAAMRAYPSHSNAMMYVGEVRDGEAASNLLRSAIDGRLVVTTVHAGDVVSGLQRLLTLASSEMDEASARELLASSFKMIIHQEIKNGILRATALVSNTGVQSNIRKSSFSLLGTEVNRQHNAIITKRGLG